MICKTCGAERGPRADWCGRCFAPFDNGREPERHEVLIVVPDVRPGSILEGGASALGLASKFLISLALTLGGVAGAAWSNAWLDMGRPMQGLVFFLAASYFALAALVLRWTWQPGRRGGQVTERIVVVDAANEIAVQRRHEALADHT